METESFSRRPAPGATINKPLGNGKPCKIRIVLFHPCYCDQLRCYRMSSPNTSSSFLPDFVA